MKKNCLILISGLMVFSLSTKAQSLYPGQHEEKLALQVKVPIKAYNFELEDVRLLDGPFKDNMMRESEWILSLAVDRLLHSFRTNAGVYSGKEGGYSTVKKLGGWESLDCELRGHTTGHILSGLALLYASTGDKIYKTKADSLVSGLADVQEALRQNGYLSAYPQNLIDRNIAGQRVWAPWYTLHKIFSGLIDQYLHADNQQALEIVNGMASWAYQKLEPLSAEQRETMIRNEFGGMNDSFYSLYAITGNPEHKFLAEFFYHEDMLEPLLKQEDILEKKHANTFIPKLIGISRGYELEGEEKYKTIADFFWNTVVDHHSFITGSNSDKEKFFKPDHLSEHLTGYTGESCNVYNMLKLTRHLFAYNPEVKYADYYEKALYNHILGQQDPETGMVAYFLPMMAGAHKVYSTPEQSFWCCVGTGFENHAKYGEAIYAHSEDGLYVNLFIPSELNWKEKGIKVRQETKFPEEGTTTLTVITSSSPVKMPLYIRYPSWATSGATIKINGKRVKVKQTPGSYITLDQKWKNDDQIEVTFPMELKAVATPDNPDKVAFTYGPVVLAGKMGTEGMNEPAPFSNPDLHNDYYTYDYNVPGNITNELVLDKNNIEKYIQPVDGENPLTFTIENKGIVLEPIYSIHQERHIIYWDLTGKKDEL